MSSHVAPDPDALVNPWDREHRVFARVEDAHYALSIPSLGIVLDVERVRLERHQWYGELTVLCELPGARTVGDGVLVSCNFNLSALQSRKTLAAHLAPRAPKDPGLGVSDLPWAALLEDLCLRVLEAERRGQPAVVLREVTRRDDDDHFEALGLTWPRHQSGILFGDGQSLKSYLALATLVELEGRGIRTLFADWERSEPTHRRRLEEIAGPDMPALRYVRCEKPLVQEWPRLRRIVREERIGYAALDSVAFGTSGAPESAEAAMEYNRCVRQLGIGVLLVAHIVKGENGEHRPFGSVFWHNSASATWFVKRAATLGDDRADVELACFHRKTNDGPERPVVGVRAHFGDGRVRLMRIAASTIQDEKVVTEVPLWQRMKQLLVREGPMATPHIAEELGVSPDAVKKTVQRKAHLFSRDATSRVAVIDDWRAS